MINDLKSAAAAQVAKPRNARVPFTTVFDEFSVFAGDQVLNLINQGRSVGVRAVLATQSVADIGRAAANGPDHFIRQVFASCNSNLIQRLNADDDVTAMAGLIGTRDTIEHTAQVDLLGATGLGSSGGKDRRFADRPCRDSHQLNSARQKAKRPPNWTSFAALFELPSSRSKRNTR